MTLLTCFRAALLGLTVLFGLGCKGEEPPPAADDTTSAAPAAPSSPHGNLGTKDPHAMNPHAPAPAQGADLSAPPAAGGLTWSDAAPLTRRAPKSPMRAAEYGLAGDDNLELAVFYFGPDQGGTVDANITRWLGQIAQADGSDTASKAKRTTRDVGGVSVSMLEVTGTYSGGMMMPGAPQAPPMTNATMLAAIASGPNGPLFFKMIGPSEAVEQSRAAFDQMIGSLRKQ
jgi:hypothetical protein